MVNYAMRYQKKPVFSHAIKSGDEKSQNYNPEILSPSGNYTIYSKFMINLPNEAKNLVSWKIN